MIQGNTPSKFPVTEFDTPRSLGMQCERLHKEIAVLDERVDRAISIARPHLIRDPRDAVSPTGLEKDNELMEGASPTAQTLALLANKVNRISELLQLFGNNIDT